MGGTCSLNFEDVRELIMPSGPRPARAPRATLTVLLLGETGSGKSTFINYLGNYFLGGKLGDLKVLIPNRIYRNVTEPGYPEHSEQNIDEFSLSQTRMCTTYSFTDGDAVYNFIDTPGINDPSDPRVAGVDQGNMKLIIEAVAKVSQLEAVILIVSGSCARMTPSQKSALDSIASNYPDLLRDNLIVVYTNASTGTNAFDERSLPMQPKKSFTMQNSAFCRSYEQLARKDQNLQKVYWTDSMETIREIVIFVNELQSQSTVPFSEIVLRRNEIKDQMSTDFLVILEQLHLIDTLKELEVKEANVRAQLQAQSGNAQRNRTYLESLQAQKLQIKSDLARYAAQQQVIMSKLTEMSNDIHSDIQKMVNSIKELEAKHRSMPPKPVKQYPQLIPTPGYNNTTCVNCWHTCHENCSLMYTENLGDNIFKRCAAMDGDHCGECKRNWKKTCDYHSHVHKKDYKIESKVPFWSVESLHQASLKEYQKRIEEMTVLEQKFNENLKLLSAKMALINNYNSQLQSLSNLSSNSSNLDNIKAKISLALQEKQAIEANISALTQEREDILRQQTNTTKELERAKAQLKTGLNTIETNCRALKKLCRGYNVSYEMERNKKFLINSMAAFDNKAAVLEIIQRFEYLENRLAS